MQEAHPVGSGASGRCEAGLEGVDGGLVVVVGEAAYFREVELHFVHGVEGVGPRLGGEDGFGEGQDGFCIVGSVVVADDLVLEIDKFSLSFSEV